MKVSKRVMCVVIRSLYVIMNWFPLLHPQRIVLTLLVVAVHQSCGIIVSQGTAGPVKRFVPLGTAERVVSAHTFDTKNPEPWGNKQFKEITITKNVPGS